MRPLAAALLAVAALAGPLPGRAFRDAPLGTPIRQRTLPTIDGKRAPLLADGGVSVFVFVRAQQDHTDQVLGQLARLEVELAAKPVRFVAIVSDTDRDGIRASIAGAGVKMPVLVDEGDALYGELGVKQHPCAGIVRKDGRLSGFQPFRKVNFLDAMRGQVQLALGEIDEAALARVLDPGVQTAPSGGRARARLKLARTLLASGSVEGAIENARAGVALEPELADAHAVLAEALARAGRCTDSAREVVEARRLAPGAGIAAPACTATAGR